MPLVATPRPRRGEPLLAFVLRLAEYNGHPTPGLFLREVDVSEKELRTIQIPLDSVAAALDCDVGEIAHLRYIEDGRLREKGPLWLNGHRIFMPYVQLRSTPICVDCVLEDQFISAYWHLRYAVACPRHGCRSLYRCPSCGSPLSWYRKGLLRCQCGYRLDRAPQRPKIDERMRGVLEILRRRVMDEPLDDDGVLANAGYPLAELAGVSLGALVMLIGRLGNVARERGLPCPYTGADRGDDDYAIAVTDSALRDWPHGFFAFMDSLFSRDVEDPDHPGPVIFALRKRTQSLYDRLFKEGPAEEYAFILRAFSEWALERPANGPVDRRLIKTMYWEQASCSLNELAERSGIDVRKARDLVKAGVIDADVFHSEDGTVRYFCDLRRLAHFSPCFGSVYSERRAAKPLGLPVSVLRAIRNLDLFHFGCVCSKPGQYHQVDLNRLAEALSEAASGDRINPARSDNMVSLREVMRWKVGSSEAKARVVAAVIQGELPPLRPGTEDPKTILLDRNAARAYVGRSSAEATGLRRTVEAAKLLGCAHDVLLALIDRGYIDAHRSGRGRLVVDASLAQFAERYISCARVASAQGTSSTRVGRDCEALGIELLRIPRTSSASPQTFIERTDLVHLNIDPLPVFAEA
jgi:excisionase family DNA binding protein